MSKSLLTSKIKRRRVTYPIQEVDPKFLTQKQFVTECDINNIVSRAKLGIAPTFQPRGTPHYGDFTDVPTIERAYETVQNAYEAFMALPSALRAELNNDPVNLGSLTRDQAERYRLLKTVPTPGSNPPSQQSPGSSAVQAQPTGTEPVATPTK